MERTSSLRDLILQFKQGDDEPMKSAWTHFQDLIKQVPHHGIQKWLLVQIVHDNISQDDHRKIDQFAQFRFGSLTEEEGWDQIEEYVQYQDDLWDDMSPPMNVSSISEAMQPTFRGRLKRACNQISYLETPTRETNLAEQVCLSEGDIYDDPSLLRSGISTQDLPFPTLPKSTSANHTEGVTKKEGPEDTEPSIIQEPALRPSIFYQSSKSSNLPFLSRLKKQKKDDKDEKPLLIFKQIHINLHS
ncbi:hypothetical protein Tco_1027369 [Tanacetum coccineum]